MKVTEKIRKELRFGTAMGTYKCNERGTEVPYQITEEDVLDALQEHEVDVTDIIPACNVPEDLYRINERYEECCDNLDEAFGFPNGGGNREQPVYFEVNSEHNTYNWHASATLEYEGLDIHGHSYTYVRYHRYGDVRGNYTDAILYDLSCTDDEFHQTLADIIREDSVEVNGHTIWITHYAHYEAGCYDIYCQELDIYDDNVYVHADMDDEEELIAWLVERHGLELEK